MLLENDFHVMLPGPTGTGKSINAYNLISSGMGEISEEAAEHKRFDTEELEKAEEAARKQKEAVDDNGDDAIAEATE